MGTDVQSFWGPYAQESVTVFRWMRGGGAPRMMIQSPTSSSSGRIFAHLGSEN